MPLNNEIVPTSIIGRYKIYSFCVPKFFLCYFVLCSHFKFQLWVLRMSAVNIDLLLAQAEIVRYIHLRNKKFIVCYAYIFHVSGNKIETMFLEFVACRNKNFIKIYSTLISILLRNFVSQLEQVKFIQ